MKIVRILSFILALAMLSCTFIACDDESDHGELPKDAYSEAWYTTTVSFRILYETKENSADEEGNSSSITTTKVMFDVTDYEYKSHKAPTILNIITEYLSVEANYTYKIDKKNNILTKIGNQQAKAKQRYWTFAQGTGDNMGELLTQEKMSNYDVVEKDCKEFTVILKYYSES